MPAPTITPLPTPPSRSADPANFSTQADAFIAALPDFVADANAQASYLDGLASSVDSDAAIAAQSAADAAISAQAAASSANYKGDYSAGVTYQIGDTVTYSGELFMAKTVNTGVTPVNGANWYLIANGDVTLSGVQTLTNKTLTSPVLNASRSDVVAVAASNIDCAAGSYFTKTATGALNWTASNIPATGAFSFVLELTNGGTGAQTWFTGIKWPNGIAPTLAASGVDILGFITDDAGTTWRGVQLMKDSK